jgi:chromosome segregation ATPase
MRRLNLVLQELERVTHEKNSLLDQVDCSSKDIDEMHMIINGEDNTDKVNRYMQDDLGVERSQNTELKDRIKDAERTSSNLVQELKKLQNEGESRANENTHFDSELLDKVGRVKELENEHYYTMEKVKQTDRLIAECRNEEAVDSRQKASVQHKIGVLMKERNELLQKLESLTLQYDQTVKEITADRHTITQHNKR